MTTETNDLAGAGSEIVAPESVETPEVTTPESDVKQDPQTEETKPSDDGDKTVKRMERRIDRLTASKYQAEARAQELERQLQQYMRAQQPEDGQQQIKPEDIERLVTEKAREIAQAEALTAKVQGVMSQGQKIADFDALCNAVNEEVQFYEKGRPTAFLEAVLDSDAPHQLLAHLGKNPELAEGLQGLTPAQLGRRIARIEADMNKQPEQPKPSNAPKPLVPVKAASGSVTPGADSPDFLAWKLKQLKG